MFTYAQINSDNEVINILQTPNEIIQSDMIRLEENDASRIQGSWKWIKDQWVEPIHENSASTDVQPTNAEIAQMVNNLRADMEIGGLI